MLRVPTSRLANEALPSAFRAPPMPRMINSCRRVKQHVTSFCFCALQGLHYVQLLEFGRHLEDELDDGDEDDSQAPALY